MNPALVQAEIARLVQTLGTIGAPLQALLPAAAVVLVALAAVPAWRALLGPAVSVSAFVLLLGEIVLAWFHWRLYALAVVVSPDTGRVAGRVAVPLWVESEKLFVWALALALMAVLIRKHRQELLPGVAVILAALMAGAALWGKPFTEPLPSFLGQYLGYLQAMASGDPTRMFGAYQGMEGARQFYYNTVYMWVHPPALFFAYATFAISFVATLVMVRERHSAYETTAYRWARLGYLPLTAGMLLGFPWAIIAWQGESWWWSGKVNMSIMMWILYTALLHARLYLRRQGMWRWVAAISILAFLVLLLTYLATYIVPGAHSYL
ncbi:MAG: cytochrome c biogenesis protein CcsA [Coriobacteriia bacterium]|nr:cytochrome c biogenesis protein CcsA [Coriobacteriia bacterium]